MSFATFYGSFHMRHFIVPTFYGPQTIDAHSNKDSRNFHESNPFLTWENLPDCALLSIKWRLENEVPFWHWVVFLHHGKKNFVLDSKKGLKNDVRTDLRRMKPKCFITVRIKPSAGQISC